MSKAILPLRTVELVSGQLSVVDAEGNLLIDNASSELASLLVVSANNFQEALSRLKGVLSDNPGESKKAQEFISYAGEYL
jgi:hypothetical protein